jgi:hypothetical protein
VLLSSINAPNYEKTLDFRTQNKKNKLASVHAGLMEMFNALAI